MPDAPILVKRQATPMLPDPSIRQLSRKNTVTRAHLIRRSSSLVSNIGFSSAR